MGQSSIPIYGLAIIYLYSQSFRVKSCEISPLPLLFGKLIAYRTRLHVWVKGKKTPLGYFKHYKSGHVSRGIARVDIKRQTC